MKKLNKVLLAGLMGVAAVSTLASCSNATESYANKINKEAQDGDEDYITYEAAKKALGKECIDITVTVLGSTNGVLVAVKGCKTQEEIQKKIDEGKEVKGIYITVINNKCTAAAYKVITASDVK